MAEDNKYWEIDVFLEPKNNHEIEDISDAVEELICPKDFRKANKCNCDEIEGEHHHCGRFWMVSTHRFPVSDDNQEPRKGSLAYCSMNKLGLITSDGPVEVEYSDGNKGMAWVGIQLTDADEETHREYAKRFNNSDDNHPANFVGGPWSSRTPRVVGHIDDIIEYIEL